MTKKHELLCRLYAIHAPTCHEWPMISFVKEYVGKRIPDAKVQIDKLGNLYITKETAETLERE